MCNFGYFERAGLFREFHFFNMQYCKQIIADVFALTLSFHTRSLLKYFKIFAFMDMLIHSRVNKQIKRFILIIFILILSVYFDLIH